MDPDAPFYRAADAKIGEVMIDEQRLQARIRELGAEITRDYVGREPLLICVLKGAVLFMADLARAVELPIDMDFMAVSSYGSGTSSSGVVRIVKDLDSDLTGRDVILVEDIIDSGLTLSYLRKALLAREPASFRVCSLLVRDSQQIPDDELRYVGFQIPHQWVVGYGLDVAQRFRNLPFIASYKTD